MNQLTSMAAVVACWLGDYATTRGIHCVYYIAESKLATGGKKHVTFLISD
jgi:hypothetical protein